MGDDKQMCGSGKCCAIGAVFLVILAVAEISRAWTGWQHEAGQFGQIGNFARNSLCAVTLNTGQIYYGTLAEAKDGYLRISELYYIQSVPQPNGAPMQFRVVNRQKTDWHSPDWMAIPIDKVLFVENVGASSRLEKLIEQERGGAH